MPCTSGGSPGARLTLPATTPHLPSTEKPSHLGPGCIDPASLRVVGFVGQGHYLWQGSGYQNAVLIRLTADSEVEALSGFLWPEETALAKPWGIHVAENLGFLSDL